MLAHSLRDAGTTKKLVVLITPDSVSAEVVAQLEVSLQIPRENTPKLLLTHGC